MDVVALAQSGFGNAVATLGTACTAEHVQKLVRFTDAVVFSFDGDAAGRRAAGRALEASLPHASDTRSFRFLFLPTEHDPDSYVRELGAEAFEQRVAGAVPLSKQIVAQAGEGLDFATAEGRARFLANVQPLWTALPEGMLKRQLLGEIASRAALATDELAALWRVGGAARGRPAPPPGRPARRPVRAAAADPPGDPPAARPASPGCCCSKAPGGRSSAPPTMPCSAPCPAGTARRSASSTAKPRSTGGSPGRRCASASPRSPGARRRWPWSTARIRRSSRCSTTCAARWRSCATADQKRAAAQVLGRAG